MTQSNQLGFHSFNRIAAANRGAVCTSHPLASQAGAEMIREGGNAIDAALAAAAVLAVVEPPASHLGGDVFLVAHVARDGKQYALNGSGNAPRAATLERYANGIPERGPLSVTVPGAVHGWCEASSRWGQLPLTHVLQPAIEYARDGFPVGRKLSIELETNRKLLSSYAPSASQYLAQGTEFGTTLKQPKLAATLEAIASGGAEAFYTGDIAREIVRALREQGGIFELEDLSEHATTVTEPLEISYRGVSVLGQPPVSQGHILLQELNIVENFPLQEWGPLAGNTLHVGIEAKKLAFADRSRYLGDPAYSEIPLEWLLSKEYGAKRAALIDMDKAQAYPSAGTLPASFGKDTTYLAAADSEGNAVSWIQSVFFRFGSGVVAGDTGVLLNNRMNGFVLDPDNPNALAPGKRPVHTLNAYLLMQDGHPWVIGGTPGANYQVQTNLQIISALVDHGLSIAEANDMPWWASETGNEVVIESRVPEDTISDLGSRGHEVRLTGPWSGGRTVQLIQLLPDGTLFACSDMRGEGHPAVL